MKCVMELVKILLSIAFVSFIVFYLLVNFMLSIGMTYESIGTLVGMMAVGAIVHEIVRLQDKP